MRENLVAIDGSEGEGGGQILRSSLALSLVTGIPFRIEKIRAGRSKPGLLRQHLTAVNAAAQVSGADARGASLGSRELTFVPGVIRPGDYRFAVGTAGSATLVLQTVLPALLGAGGPSQLTLEGGTHNPFAPPFDFLARAFLPLLERMGARVEAVIEHAGFYPAGGGLFRVAIAPATALRRLDLRERGEVRRRSARALVSGLSLAIAHRELKAVRKGLSWDADCLHAEEVKDAQGPGNICMLEIESAHVTEVFTGFGERGRPAEAVAAAAIDEARRYLASGAPVGVHLADQLLLPLALAGGGSFRTVAPSRHTTTNAEVLKKFLDVDVRLVKEARDVWLVEVERR
jgi:RNA 3'-terminal phosphate cyclase (ATP)